MGATVALRNIVGVTEYIFLEAVIPLKGDLNTYAICFGSEVENIVNRAFIVVEILNKGAKTTLITENFFFATALID